MERVTRTPFSISLNNNLQPRPQPAAIVEFRLQRNTLTGVTGGSISDRKRETAVRRGMLPKSPRQSWFAACRRRTYRLLNYAHAGIGQIRAVKEPIVTWNGHTSPEGRDGGSCQLRRSGSNPGGDRPILTRCRRIRPSSSGFSMMAMTFISVPHFGHSIGSTS